MAYEYPFKPWFNLTTSPKCLFWPLLIGSCLFWFIMSVLRSAVRTLIDIFEMMEEERQSSCCSLNFALKMPFFLLVMGLAWPLGIHHHLKKDVAALWGDVKYSVQWHRERP